MIIYELREAEDNYTKTHILKNQATILDQQMFKYAYDKVLSFGLKFSDANIEVNGILQDPTEVDFYLLDRLATRELSGDMAREEVEIHCDVNGPLVKLICNKKLSCGVTATTVNKVFYGLVPQFKVQLAKALPLDKVKFPCFAETKYDGVRIVIRVDEDGVEFKTRNGLVVALPKLAALIHKHSILHHHILDTEVTLKSGLMTDRTKVSGMINSAMKGGTIDESLLVFNIFDYLSTAEFDYGKCDHPYIKRRVFVQAAEAVLKSEQFLAAKAWECNSPILVNTIYQAHIAQGFEGLILKHADSMYTYKRTTDWAKMKEVLTADLQCTGIVPGTGKYQNMIGALICEGVVDGIIVHVQAGSGLTDQQRNIPQHMYVGKTIELKYNTIVHDKTTGKFSLFLPRFVTVRTDK